MVSTELQQRCQGVVEVLSGPNYKTKKDHDDAKMTETEAQGEKP
jgi:hypothetical protein